MTIAPSFAGLTGASRLSLNYRNQWPSVGGTFVTFSGGVDHFFKRAKSGLGLLVFRDQAGNGNLALTEAGVQYSYRIRLGKKVGGKNSEWFIRPGIHFKYAQRSLNFHKLTFGDQFNADGTQADNSIETAPHNKKGYIDFAASVIGYNDLYWGGVAVDHLLRPNQSLTGQQSKVPLKISVFGGAKILLKDKRSRRIRYGREPEHISFAAYYRLQEKYDQLDLGAYWERDPLVIGLWFRGIPVLKSKSTGTSKSGGFSSIDAIIILVGAKLTPSLKIGYSFDFTISGLLSNTGGAHEVSLVYLFNKNMGKFGKKHTIIPCPSF